MIERAQESQWAAQDKVGLEAIRAVRGGFICLEGMFHSFSGAPQCCDHAAVSDAARLPQHTCSGVWLSCDAVWLLNWQPWSVLKLSGVL